MPARHVTRFSPAFAASKRCRWREEAVCADLFDVLPRRAIATARRPLGAVYADAHARTLRCAVKRYRVLFSPPATAPRRYAARAGACAVFDMLATV